MTDVKALLQHLRECLGRRRIESGFRALDEALPLLKSICPEKDHSGELLGLLAQWVDAGYDGFELLQRTVAAFPGCTRASLPLREYLNIRLAEGVLAMSEEDFDAAEAHFTFIQSLHGEIGDNELLAAAAFWNGRCLRKTGRYDDAVSHTAEGESIALACGYHEMAAVMQMSRAWLAFQKGKLAEATAVLRRAEAAFSQTDDYLSRGNVQSAYGRIARRQGRFEQALSFFETAIGEYRRAAGSQLQLARALLNIAIVKRLAALRRQNELEAEPAESKVSNLEARRQQRARIERIRAEAHADLEESLAIYTRAHNHRGIAGVLINLAFLHLDGGDLEAAEGAAAEAFRHGEGKHDYLVMSRARTLQCAIENARMEEQIGDPARLFESADAFARDAVTYARQTQNRRLLARALISQGLTHSISPRGNRETARSCAEQAIALTRHEAGEGESVWEDLEKLKSAALNSAPIDATLRSWSAGIVGNKSFQQITEEFARLVIPRVWEREGRKISRVSARLSISPKKVRRILQDAGLMEPGAASQSGAAG